MLQRPMIVGVSYCRPLIAGCLVAGVLCSQRVLVYDFTALLTDYGRKPGPPKPPYSIREV